MNPIFPLLTAAAVLTHPLMAGTAPEMAPVLEEKLPMNFIDPALLGFGAPGISLVMNASAPMDIEGTGDSVDLYDGRFSTPVWGRDLGNGTLVGVGVAYGYTSLDTDSTLGLARQDLHTVDLRFTAVHFPKTDRGWMGLAMLSPGLSSDFSDISSDDFSFTGIFVAGYQYSQRLTVAGAAVYTHTPVEDRVIPGFGVLWRPSKEWTFQLTPPIMAIGWTPRKEWTFSIAAYPAGSAWDVDREGAAGDVEAVKLDLLRAGFGVEYRHGANLRLTAMAGTNFGGELELRDGDGHKLFDRDLDPSAYGLLGVSWTF